MKSPATIIATIIAAIIAAMLLLASCIESKPIVKPEPAVITIANTEELHKLSMENTSLQHAFNDLRESSGTRIAILQDRVKELGDKILQLSHKPAPSVSANLPVSGTVCESGNCPGLPDGSPLETWQYIPQRRGLFGRRR